MGGMRTWLLHFNVKAMSEGTLQSLYLSSSCQTMLQNGTLSRHIVKKLFCTDMFCVDRKFHRSCIASRPCSMESFGKVAVMTWKWQLLRAIGGWYSVIAISYELQNMRVRIPVSQGQRCGWYVNELHTNYSSILPQSPLHGQARQVINLSCVIVAQKSA